MLRTRAAALDASRPCPPTNESKPTAGQSFAQLQAKVGDSALYQQAEVLAQWGEPEQALQKLQRARQVGDSGLTYAATDLFLDPLRHDSNFTRFVNTLTLS